MATTTSALKLALSHLARLRPYYGPSRGWWLIAVVATALAAATEPMIPALLKALLDKGFKNSGQVALWQIPAL
ncbi:MAG: lipid ABC transporter permease/ATP-binding protein, partial [Comamonadaceae bacterium]|nr:lipid ABC transporter permease/ATP-binding protein [Comamonadaceae bacterium]